MYDPVRSNRREALKSLGFVLLSSTAAGMAISPVAAQAPGTVRTQPLQPGLAVPRPNVGVATPNAELLQLHLSDPRAVQTLALTKRLPPGTPIAQMGLDPRGRAALTPGAQRLTKADLEALAQGRVTPATQNLTVQDIQSVQTAFRTGFGGLASIDVSCCCCTPCCCAAAMDKGSALAA